jgi:hypothetical protein
MRMMAPIVIPLRDDARLYVTDEKLTLQRQDTETREWRDYSTAIDPRDWVLIWPTADDGARRDCPHNTASHLKNSRLVPPLSRREDDERRHRQSRERAERRRREKDGWITAPVRYNANPLPYWLERCRLIELDEVDDPKCVAGAIEEILATLQAEGLWHSMDMSNYPDTHMPSPWPVRPRQTYRPKRQDRPPDPKLGWAWRPPKKT